MKIRNLDDWQAFVAVAKEKNFARAAGKLRISAPMLSKKIARLEETLDLRLLQRTTRSVALTHEGETLLPEVRRMLESVESLESTFDRKKSEVAGPIRMTVPTVYAERVLPPLLMEFRRLYPAIVIEVTATDSLLNLIDGHVDVAIRSSRLVDSTMIARRLTPNVLLACASPAYLKKAPRLKTPQDLQHHDLLFLDVHENVRFRQAKVSLGQLGGRRRFLSNNGGLLTRMACQGAGVAIRSFWDCQPFLKTGELKIVLKDFPFEENGDVWLVLPSKRQLSPRVRVFVDFLSGKLGGTADRPRGNP